MKKNTKIAIGIVSGLIIVGILFLTLIVLFFIKMLDKYEFTSEEQKSIYSQVSESDGYTTFEDENITFKYPSDWYMNNELTETTDDVIFVENEDPATTPNIQYQIVDAEVLGMYEEQYKPFQFSIKTTTNFIDGNKIQSNTAERWLMVNDKKTYMWYAAGNNEVYPDELRYNLEYYSFIDDGKILFVRLSIEDKEEFDVMAASLDY